ncbi:MAG: hypothetical protein KME18_11540 [Phormidium tanganyikae FI6-MK23]|jgi:hypothetical protein|nr:hypothetical protein [Phormidium tanganyikae FI6-MK23]
MNQTVEKWLTIGALVGWVASIGSLVGLVLRAASPAIASRPVQASRLHSPSRNLEMYSFKTQVNQPPSDLFAIQQEIVAPQIPIDTSKGFWAESLKERSNSSFKWMSQRSQ